MTNLRANANLIGAHVTSADIVATVAIGDSSDTILYPQQTVASTVTGMRFNNSPVTLCGCVSHNASLVGGSGTPAFDGSIQVIEIFANSMRRRNIGITVDGPTPPLVYPQNVSGFAYPYETGFLPSPVAVSPPGYTLEPADSGARFVLSFSNVPAGVQIFLPVSVTEGILTQSGYPPNTGIYQPLIQLVEAQPNGFSGPAYTAIPSTATIGTTPVAQASRVETTAFATYEVVNVETAEADTFNIRFALAFNGSTPQSGTIVPLASLAPISTMGVAATNSEPVPRFVATNFTPPLIAGDFDNNGVPDRVWQNDTTGQATLHYAGYTGLDLQIWNWLNNSVIPTWRIVAVADFNGDGIPDLVWRDSVTREVTVHYYGGGGGAVQQGWKWLQSSPVPGWTVVAATDFNGDGVPDLVWQNDTTREVVVHYYGGTGGAVYQGWNWLQSTAVAGWHVVGAADFNRDVVPDLVWQNDTTGQVNVHYSGGPGGAVYQNWAPLNNNADAPTGWTIKAVSDVNGDGVPDLLWQNSATHQVTVNYYGGSGGASIIGWNWISQAGVPGWSVVH